MSIDQLSPMRRTCDFHFRDLEMATSGYPRSNYVLILKVRYQLPRVFHSNHVVYLEEFGRCTRSPQTDGTDGRTDGRTDDGRTERTDGRTDGRTDQRDNRQASTILPTIVLLPWVGKMTYCASGFRQSLKKIFFIDSVNRPRTIFLD